jgi:hypothetical protein
MAFSGALFSTDTSPFPMIEDRNAIETSAMLVTITVAYTHSLLHFSNIPFPQC